MTLIDLLRSAWAIVPDRLDEIQAIYATHLRGEKIDLEAVEARLGRPLANDQQEYTVRDGGVAVLPIEGVIAAKANLFTRISGGTSAQMLTQQVQSMAADPRVRSVILELDTPGGSVFGIPELAGAVKAMAGEKPVVAVSTGMMASAGYWIGSAANAVYASGTTDVIGSIGVVMTHSYDPRGAQVQKTEITAGRYKRMATDAKPLDAEGKAYLQQQVDHIYSVFVDTVAENRRASAEQVLERMADGRVFIGQQAADAGLIDGIATVDQLAERLASTPEKFAARRKAVFALGSLPAAGAAAAAEPPKQDEPVSPVAPEPNTQEVTMTPQETAAKFAAENPEAAAVLRAAGAAAEQSRVAEVRAQSMPGHEKLIEALAADGKTTGAEAAMAVIAAERASVASAAATRLAGAPKAVPQAAAEADPKPEAAEGKADVLGNPQALDAKVRAYMAEHKVSYLAALSAVTETLEA
jgi:signal peptide peptidase SppA